METRQELQRSATLEECKEVNVGRIWGMEEWRESRPLRWAGSLREW
jgi:hypothetical protein